MVHSESQKPGFFGKTPTGNWEGEAPAEPGQKRRAAAARPEPRPPERRFPAHLIPRHPLFGKAGLLKRKLPHHLTRAPQHRRVARGARGTLLHAASLVVLLLCHISHPPCAMPQEIPQRNASAFGFPYPPPPPDEPGVTPFRRYMLDGEPHLRFRPRAQDQIWSISTRDIKTPDQVRLVKPRAIQCKRCESAQLWSKNTFENLLVAHSADTGRATVVFVHGYRTDEFWAERRGLQAYQAIVGNDPAAPPVRFVIWSWPSETDRPFTHGFREKNERALLDGQVLSWMLQQFDSKQPVGLLGYSLGVQIVLTGLEGLDSTLQGDGDQPRLTYNVAAIAPVTHCHWPRSFDEVSRVSGHLESMLVFRNSRDRALGAYDLFCRLNSRQPGCGIDAFGHHANVTQFDVAKSVGSEHNFVNYISDSFVRNSVRDALLGAREKTRVASPLPAQQEPSGRAEFAVR